MIKITATKLRNNLFEYLDKVYRGETVVIERNKQEVARMISPPVADWREKMKVQPKLICPAEEIVQPMEDIWEEYI
jgi:prevent-host-death family protein